LKPTLEEILSEEELEEKLKAKADPCSTAVATKPFTGEFVDEKSTSNFEGMDNDTLQMFSKFEDIDNDTLHMLEKAYDLFRLQMIAKK
jgi:hypothetical protein